jgi:hypothetical protein
MCLEAGQGAITRMICCQLGWKSHPITIIEGSFLPSALVPKQKHTRLPNGAFALIQSTYAERRYGPRNSGGHELRDPALR